MVSYKLWNRSLQSKDWMKCPCCLVKQHSCHVVGNCKLYRYKSSGRYEFCFLYQDKCYCFLLRYEYVSLWKIISISLFIVEADWHIYCYNYVSVYIRCSIYVLIIYIIAAEGFSRITTYLNYVFSKELIF
jgi:hypothetical protein